MALLYPVGKPREVSGNTIPGAAFWLRKQVIGEALLFSPRLQQQLRAAFPLRQALPGSHPTEPAERYLPQPCATRGIAEAAGAWHTPSLRVIGLSCQDGVIRPELGATPSGRRGVSRRTRPAPSDADMPQRKGKEMQTEGGKECDLARPC